MPLPRIVRVAAAATALALAAPAPPVDAAARQRPGADREGLPTLSYHGGPVMTSPVRLYVIWYGSWAAKVRRRAVITDFLRHLTGPRAAINATYTDARGNSAAPSIRWAGQITDSGSLGLRRVSDDAIGLVVMRALRSGRLPVDAHGIYLVLTSTNVDKTGLLTRFCGWHSVRRHATTMVKIVLVGDPSGPMLQRCAPPRRGPNGDPGADAMVNTIAHEIDETVTNPEFTGWFDRTGGESADRCAAIFPHAYRIGSGWANVQLGPRHFLLQGNWVNRPGGGCALAATTQ